MSDRLGPATRMHNAIPSYASIVWKRPNVLSSYSVRTPRISREFGRLHNKGAKAVASLVNSSSAVAS